MDNSIILTIINLVGKNKTNDIIDRGFLDQTINLNEEDILSCLKKYKEIDTEFDIPSLEEVKISIEDSVKVLLESDRKSVV